MQTLESIAQVLRDWGLHAGSWARRHDLARTIAGTHKQFDDAAARALFDEAKDARAARNPAGRRNSRRARGRSIINRCRLNA